MPRDYYCSPAFGLAAITLADTNQPSNIPVAMIGDWYKGKQKFSITEADVAAMTANFKKRGNSEVVIDYEHASEDPEVARGGPVPAAGWIVHINQAPDANGVVWGKAKFNARARDMIATGEYRYGSPALSWGYRDKNNGEQQGLTLTSFALTNRPFLEEMPAIRLSDAGWTENKGEKPNMITGRELRRIYGEDLRKNLSEAEPAPVTEQLNSLDTQIIQLSEEKAKESGISFADAFKLTLRERPDLNRRRNQLKDRIR